MSAAITKPPEIPSPRMGRTVGGVWRKNYIEYLEAEARKEDSAAKSRGFCSVEI